MVATNNAKPRQRSSVLLVEELPIVRLGLARLIDDQPDLFACGGAESPDEALEVIPRLKPDIVVVDIALGERSGLELIKSIHDTWPSLLVLALSVHDETLYAERALRAGAKGYIMKKEPIERVMGAIRRILAGDIYVSEKMASRMVHKLIGGNGGSSNGSLERLSDREFQVFNFISRSVGPTQIAQRLSVSVRTIETHREHIKQKLGLRSGAELTRFALEWAIQQR